MRAQLAQDPGGPVPSAEIRWEDGILPSHRFKTTEPSGREGALESIASYTFLPSGVQHKFSKPQVLIFNNNNNRRGFVRIK